MLIPPISGGPRGGPTHKKIHRNATTSAPSSFLFNFSTTCLETWVVAFPKEASCLEEEHHAVDIHRASRYLAVHWVEEAMNPTVSVPVTTHQL